MAVLKEVVKSLGKTMHKISTSIGSSNGSAESASQSTPNMSPVTSAAIEPVTKREPPTPVFSCSLQAPISYTPPLDSQDQGHIAAGRSYHVTWGPKVEGKEWVFNVHEAGTSTIRFVVPAYVFEGKFRFEMTEPPFLATAIRSRHRFGEQHLDVEEGDLVTIIAVHGKDWVVARPQNPPPGIIARHGLIPSSYFNLDHLVDRPSYPLTAVDMPPTNPLPPSSTITLPAPSTEEDGAFALQDGQLVIQGLFSIGQAEAPAGQPEEIPTKQTDEARPDSHCPRCQAPMEPHIWGFVHSVSLKLSDTTDAHVFEMTVDHVTCFQADPTVTPNSILIHRDWSHFYAIDLVLRSKLKNSLIAGQIPPDPLPDGMGTSMGKSICMDLQIKILEKWLRQVCALALQDSTRAILWSARLTRFFLDPNFAPRR